MYTKERDGGKMGKKIKKIAISPESIDVFSEVNGVNNIVQISIDEKIETTKEILEKYNLSEITNYEFDEKIVRALALDEEGKQLRDYLEICRRVKNGEKNIDIAKNMPEIEYDLRSLREYGN